MKNDPPIPDFRHRRVVLFAHVPPPFFLRTGREGAGVTIPRLTRRLAMPVAHRHRNRYQEKDTDQNHDTRAVKPCFWLLTSASILFVR